MKLTDHDYKEIEKMADVQIKLSQLKPRERNQLLDEMNHFQFIIPALIQEYEDQLSKAQQKALSDILLLIWLYFGDNKIIRSTPVSFSMYEEKSNEHLRFLEKLGKLKPDSEEYNRLLIEDLEKVHSKALYAAVTMPFEMKGPLRRLDTQTRGALMGELIALIACFAEIADNRPRLTLSRTREDAPVQPWQEEMDLFIDDIEENLEPINRHAIVLKPKKPFFDWLNALEQYNENKISSLDENNVYLIREMDNNDFVRRWVKKHFDRLFVNELSDWCNDERLWPKKRTYKLFAQWFEVEVHSMVLDLEDEPIEKESDEY